MHPLERAFRILQLLATPPAARLEQVTQLSTCLCSKEQQSRGSRLLFGTDAGHQQNATGGEKQKTDSN